jgi:presequence protease
VRGIAACMGGIPAKLAEHCVSWCVGLVDCLGMENRIGQYLITQTGLVPHLSGTYYRLIHEPTGAQHIHVECADDNNGFIVTFPTVPQDSTGIAHILEHIVLCGSKRFPVRDPFFAMGPRSLSTFMNAFTWADRTAYPFSTRNPNDYYNLLEVYLDATFFPNIDYPSYRQEAWRYQFADMVDAQSPLEYHGVVFNEMKGGMSSLLSVMHQEVSKSVFPNLTYANNSGGDPRHIPELTWEALKAFHARHYHPSNSYFYTYGNLPLADTLEKIERLVLSQFGKIDPQTAIPDQPRFSAPIRHEASYPVAAGEDLDKKTQVLVSWATTVAGNTTDILGLSVLERVLLANAASPLRKALIESQLGEALADASGLDTDFREAVFSAGLKGVNPEDAPAIEKLILDTLHTQAQAIDVASIDAAIHRMELESREVDNAGIPYAISSFFPLAMPFINGGDPYLALQFDKAIKSLEAERLKGPFFENLIRKYFLDNPHRVTITLKPDSELAVQMETLERQNLDTIRQTLSDQQIQTIIKESQELKARQESPEDTSVLPTLELTDIPMKMEDVPYQTRHIVGSTVGLFALPTNGIGYIDLRFDVAGLPDKLKDLLPLFAYTMTKMGTSKISYLEMAERIEATTGGIVASVGQRTGPDDSEVFTQSFSLSAKALYRNQGALFAMLQDLMTDLVWDTDHLKNLLGQLKAGFESRVVQMGHLFTWSLAEAQFGGKHALGERWEGLAQLATLKQLLSADLGSLVEDLEAIRAYIFSQKPDICLTSEQEQQEGLLEHTQTLLQDLPQQPLPAVHSPLPGLQLCAQARTTAVPVAYDAKVFKTVPYSHPDGPILTVLARLLRAEYTHKEIREKGGAYGGFAVARAENATFALGSYRDPHIARTFKVFDGAIDFLASDIPAEKVKEAILGAANDADPLLSSESKGRVRFFSDLAGYTLDQKIQFKKRLLEVTLADLRRVAQTYLTRPAALAVISNEEKIKEANAEMGEIFSVKAI